MIRSESSWIRRDGWDSLGRSGRLVVGRDARDGWCRFDPIRPKTFRCYDSAHTCLHRASQTQKGVVPWYTLYIFVQCEAEPMDIKMKHILEGFEGDVRTVLWTAFAVVVELWEFNGIRKASETLPVAEFPGEDANALKASQNYLSREPTREIPKTTKHISGGCKHCKTEAPMISAFDGP